MNALVATSPKARAAPARALRSKRLGPVVIACLAILLISTAMKTTAEYTLLKRSRSLARGTSRETVLRKMGAPNREDEQSVSYCAGPSIYYAGRDWCYKKLGWTIPSFDAVVTVEFDSYGTVGRIFRKGDAAIDLSDHSRTPGVLTH